jgi:hypothetical protein
LGVDDAGKAFKAVDDIIKQTAQNTKKNEDNFKRLGDELATARDKAADLSEGFVKIDRESTRALRDIRAEQRNFSQSVINDARDFETSLRKIQEQRNDLENGGPSAAEQRARQLRDLDEQEAKLREAQSEKEQKQLEDQIKLQEKEADAKRKTQEETKKLIDQQDEQEKKIRATQKALADARAEAEKNATALEKLGVSAVGADGKLAKAPETLFAIADALKGVTDATQREKIENDLVAAGLDRKLLPALRGGADALRALEDEGKKIKPPFTPEQIKVADDFQIAVGKLGLALANIKDQVGLSLAPQFTEAFNALTKVIVDNKQEIIDFVKLVLEKLNPALQIARDFVNRFIEAMKLINDIKKFFDDAATSADKFGKVTADINVFGLRISRDTIADIGKLLAFVDKLKFAFIRAAFGDISGALKELGVDLPKIGQQIKDFFGNFTKNISFDGLARGLANIVGPAKQGFDQLVADASAAIERVKQFFSDGVSSIGSFFTETIPNAAASAWDSFVQGASSAWESVKQTFNDGVAAIGEFFTTTIPQFVSDVWEGFKQGAADAWAFVTQTFSDGVAAIGTFFTETIPNAISQAWDFLTTKSKEAWDSLVQIVSDALTSVKNFILDAIPGLRSFIDLIGKAIAGLKSLFGAQQEVNSAGGASQGLARGGPVWGRGTSTSDSIPAWLSSGEWVHNAKAVSYYGQAFMRAINNRVIPKDAFRGFSMGGLVSAATSMPMRMPLRFADGGPVPAAGGGLHPVTIDLGNGQKVTGLKATTDVVTSLKRAAVNRSTASAGRKPSYYGRGK